MLAFAADQVVEFLLKPGNITTGAVLLAVVVVLVRGTVVPRDLYDEQKKRADAMEERAFKATDAMTTAIETTEKLQLECERQREEIAWLKGRIEKDRDERDGNR